MSKIIDLEEVKKEKHFLNRYQTRKYLIEAMIMYKDKYSLDELKTDFQGLFYVMNQQK